MRFRVGLIRDNIKLNNFHYKMVPLEINVDEVLKNLQLVEGANGYVIFN